MVALLLIHGSLAGFVGQLLEHLLRKPFTAQASAFASRWRPRACITPVSIFRQASAPSSIWGGCRVIVVEIIFAGVVTRGKLL